MLAIRRLSHASGTLCEWLRCEGIGVLMQERILTQHLILTQLENLVSKVKLQSPEFSDLDCSVFPSETAAHSYVIDISEGRFARRVIVNPITVKHLWSAQFDSNLLQEIRNAMRTVARWANERK
jgi:hypothetical protein